MTNEQIKTKKYSPPRIRGANGIRLMLQFTVILIHCFRPDLLLFTTKGASGVQVVGVFFVLSGYTTYSSIASLDLSSPTPLRLIQIWVEFLAKRMIPIYILVRLLGLLTQYMYGPPGHLPDGFPFLYNWAIPYSKYLPGVPVNGALWYFGPQFLFWIIGPPIVILLLIVMSRIRDIKVPYISKFQVSEPIISAVMPVTLLMLVFSRAWFIKIQPKAEMPERNIQNRLLPYLLGIVTAHLVDAVFRYRFESESKSDLDLVLPNGQTGGRNASSNLGPLSAKSTAQGILRKFGAYILNGGCIVEIAVVMSYFGLKFKSDIYWAICMAPFFACFCLFCLSTPGASSSILARLLNSRVVEKSSGGGISMTAYVMHGAVMAVTTYNGLKKRISPPAGLIWIFTISVMCDRYVVDVSRKLVTSVLRYLESAVKLAASYLTKDEIYKNLNVHIRLIWMRLLSSVTVEVVGGRRSRPQF